jgi:hypothetical protein
MEYSNSIPHELQVDDNEQEVNEIEVKKLEETEVKEIPEIARYTNFSRKQLFEKINSLSSTEHDEIYRIVIEHSVNVSKNKNGVFFNLSGLDEDVLFKIDTFVTYCVNNKEHLDEYDKRLNECKMNNKYGKIVNMNIKLENMTADRADSAKDDWSKVDLDAKSMLKITNMIQRFQDDRERLHVKKVNSKFINAKKRFSKKASGDKKIDCEHLVELETVPYLLQSI